MILFTKYSNERSRKFRIRTDILEENGVRRICKVASSPDSVEHIKNIYASYLHLKEDLAGTQLAVNECIPGDDSVSFPYLEGQTLEEKLDGLLDKNKLAEVKTLIHSYFELFSACSQEFLPTPEFVEVFGEVSFARPQKCRNISDVDMIFANAIETLKGWELIDYEWTFAFPVPLKYLQYRCLHYYILGNAARNGISEQELMEEFDIHEEEQRQFAAMERNFQQYILGEYCPIWKQYDDISDGIIAMAPLVAKESSRKKQHPATVSFDTGNGFDEENRREYKLIQADGGSFEIELPKGTKAMRLKPYSGRCLVRIAELSQAGQLLKRTVNGSVADNGDIIFDTEDPEIIIETLHDSPVKVSLRVEPLTGVARELILNQDGKIHWMEQTKAWRLYQKLKHLI